MTSPSRELILISGVRETMIGGLYPFSSLSLVKDAGVLMTYMGRCDWDGDNPSFRKVDSSFYISYKAEPPFSDHYFNTYVAPGQEYYNTVHTIPAGAKVRFRTYYAPPAYGRFFIGVLVEYS